MTALECLRPNTGPAAQDLPCQNGDADAHDFCGLLKMICLNSVCLA
jgi:hypothetical protein